MLSWSVVFGVFGDAVLCLHREISAHFDLEPETYGPCQVDLAAGAESMSSQDDCPPCIDIEIRGSFESPRAVELVKAPAPLHVEVPSIRSKGVFPSSDEAFERTCPVRAPPYLKIQSVIVARTHVLRV